MDEGYEGVTAEISRDGDRLAVDFDLGSKVMRLLLDTRVARCLAAELIEAAKDLDAELRPGAALFWPVANGEG